MTDRATYNDCVVRRLVVAALVWGLVALALALFLGLELALWQPAHGALWTFGRLRPLENDLALFGFGGNLVFAGVYYASQRLLRVRAGDVLTSIHVWGWQLVVLAAALTLPLGMTQGKELAEFEWPIDVAILAVWAAYAANLMLMLARRTERRLYISMWFILAGVIGFGLVHVGNNLAVPVSLWKSYPLLSGAHDALVEGWYGHNALAFFLTVPMVGLAYFFVPSAVERPVYSYRMAVVQFWLLVSISAWAGPQMFLNTQLSDAVQSLGMVASILLLAPSWGGALNGLLTLGRARQEPALQFMVAGLIAYMLSALQDAVLGIKSVSSFVHYTEWNATQVALGGLGWVGLFGCGVLYWLVPRLYRAPLHCERSATTHLRLAVFGLCFYWVGTWIAALTQGAMWRAENLDGGLLYPSFIETATAVRVMDWMRLAGGGMLLLGFIAMIENLWRTARAGTVATEAVLESTATVASTRWYRVLLGAPVWLWAVIVLCGVLTVKVNPAASATLVVLTVLFAMAVAFAGTIQPAANRWHHSLEQQPVAMALLVFAVLIVGALAELGPALAERQPIRGRPYSALEIEGRDIYVAEGCNACHSQMIRPFLWESARFGDIPSPTDTSFDHPMVWGSRRIGPDAPKNSTQLKQFYKSETFT